MARIFYSMSGDGRGHATRVRAIVEALRGTHELTLFAPGDAHRFLAPLYAGTEVRVRRLAGMRFRYTPCQRLALGPTLAGALRYVGRLPSLVGMLGRILERDRPDLVITDFEPALPRAARRCGVPFLSIDHQHFLTTYDLGAMPAGLRWHAAYMGAVVRAYCRGEQATVVSAFFFPPLRRGCAHVVQTGVMLRPRFAAIAPATGAHLVAYCRRFASRALLDALAGCGREVRLYGLGRQPSRGGLEFRPTEEARFVDDLAGCAALITTAGNQIVGEALCLGKAVLALPEARNFEQELNARFLAQGGGGAWVALERVTGADIRRFLDRLGAYAPGVPRAQLNGLPRVLAEIGRHLPGAYQRAAREGVTSTQTTSPAALRQ